MQDLEELFLRFCVQWNDLGYTTTSIGRQKIRVAKTSFDYLPRAQSVKPFTMILKMLIAVHDPVCNFPEKKRKQSHQNEVNGRISIHFRKILLTSFFKILRRLSSSRKISTQFARELRTNKRYWDRLVKFSLLIFLGVCRFALDFPSILFSHHRLLLIASTIECVPRN